MVKILFRKSATDAAGGEATPDRHESIKSLMHKKFIHAVVVGGIEHEYPTPAPASVLQDALLRVPSRPTTFFRSHGAFPEATDAPLPGP